MVEIEKLSKISCKTAIDELTTITFEIDGFKDKSIYIDKLGRLRSLFKNLDLNSAFIKMNEVIAFLDQEELNIATKSWELIFEKGLNSLKQKFVEKEKNLMKTEDKKTKLEFLPDKELVTDFQLLDMGKMLFVDRLDHLEEESSKVTEETQVFKSLPINKSKSRLTKVFYPFKEEKMCRYF